MNPRPQPWQGCALPLSYFRIKLFIFTYSIHWWRDPELNRGHTDFQSVALPTELSRPISQDLYFMAGPTRLELATFGVTGRHSKPTELRPRVIINLWWAKQGSNLRPPACKAGVLPLNYPPGFLSNTGNILILSVNSVKFIF